jgi:hypothetical protein
MEGSKLLVGVTLTVLEANNPSNHNSTRLIVPCLSYAVFPTLCIEVIILLVRDSIYFIPLNLSKNKVP